MGLVRSQGMSGLNKALPSMSVSTKDGKKSEWSGSASRFIRSADETILSAMMADSGPELGPKSIVLKKSIPCPCCKQSVTVPTIEVVIDHFDLTPLEARVLGAIWRGKGTPVMPERVFDAMYVDDPDGGPTPSKMYSAFKVALCHLRKKIKGSGIDVENVGYRRGYRLVIGEK